jgi:hypothetical protein
MPITEVSPGRRWRIDELPDGVRFRIPAPKRWLMIAFVALWIVIWAVAMGNALREFLGEGPKISAFGVVWLAGWTLGGAVVIGSFLWQLLGETVIEVSDGRLRYYRGVSFVRFGRSYDASRIRNLRASKVSDDARTWFRNSDTSWLGRGLVTFEYGERSCILRPGVEPNEANNIVNGLSQFVRTADTPARGDRW